MRYKPVLELSAQLYMSLRDDVERVIGSWIEGQGIKTVDVHAIYFYGTRIRIEGVCGSDFYRSVDSIPYGTLDNLDKALRLKAPGF